jgi:hypothetical protein
MRDITITTLSTAATLDGDDRCDDQRTCPSVHVVADRPAIYHVMVTAVTDATERAAFAHLLGPGEVLGTVPRAVLDRLPR